MQDKLTRLLRSGSLGAAKDVVRFAADEDRTSSQVKPYQATPEYIAEMTQKAQAKYKHEPAMKKPLKMSWGEPKKRENTRPANEIERARRKYIECRAHGMHRTHALDVLQNELGITHHESYKLLKQWGYRSREAEEKAIISFLDLSKRADS